MPGKHLNREFCIALLLAAVSGLPSAGATPDNLPADNDGRLAKAAMQRDSDGVRTLLKQKVNVNEAQGDGMTALHWAALNDDLEMTRMLIQSGASVKAETRISADTPLFLAAKNGNAAMVEILLKAGADARSSNKTGATVLMMAAAAGSVDAVKALLDHGAEVNAVEAANGQTALMFAASLNRSDVIRTLLAQGADSKIATKAVKLGRALQYGRFEPDPDVKPDTTKAAGPTPAAGAITEEAADGGGGRGGRIVVADEDRISGAGFMGGMTALLFAARDGYMPAVHQLVEGRANINQVSADKTTPIVMAIQNGHFDIARYLLDHGADPNIANESGLAPLYATIDVQYAPLGWAPNPNTTQETISHRDLMKALLDRGADPNARLTKKLWFRALTHSVGWVDSTGATPLWRAAQSVDVPVMRLLVTHGADPKIPTKAGATPLMVAAGIGWGANFTLSAPEPDSWMEAVRYLAKLGSDVNAKDTRGYTPLGGAAFRGNNEMVTYLVEKGARVDVVAKDGNTMADMANGIFEHAVPRPETVALLEKLGSANSHNCRSNYCLIVPKTDAQKTPAKSSLDPAPKK